MKKFLKKLFFFVIGINLLIALSISHYSPKINFLKNNDNPLFVWGDSQTYQGLDLKALSRNTGRLVLSSAQHGSGVYDFIIFTEMVPESSDVLIAISEPVQFRSKKLDLNRSGFSYSALKLLFKNNYSLQELITIIRKNFFKIPNHIFLKCNVNYDNNDVANIDNELFTKIVNIYDNKFKPYTYDKQNLYIEGINILKDKNCTINLIKFPFHKLLHDKIKDLPNSDKTDLFFRKIINITDCFAKDTLYLNNSKNSFFDLTHLNAYGANNVANFIGKRLKVGEPKAFIILNPNVD